MGKEVKTNAVRILDRNKIEYELNKYECDDFKDGMSIADMLEQSYDMSFKTLVTVGKSGKYYVLQIPVDKEINMKKAAERSRCREYRDGACKRHKCRYGIYKRRLHTDRNEEKLSDGHK